MFTIEKATKKKLKSRILIEGQSGSGKTYSALVLARNLGKRICVIDTEDNSASLYADLCDFDVINMPAPYSINNLLMALEQVESLKYDVIVVDSLSAFWASSGGALEMQAKIAKTTGNSYTAWNDITPLQNKMLDKILHCKSHIICTAKVKTDYVMEEYTAKSGKTCTRPVKIGMKTIQREGLDYEFTVVFRVDRQHLAITEKSRTPIFDDFNDIITDKVGQDLLAWLNDGAIVKDEPKQVDEPTITKEDLKEEVEKVIEKDENKNFELILQMTECEDKIALKRFKKAHEQEWNDELEEQFNNLKGQM